MKRLYTAGKYGTKGFTLIESTLVILVIGMIAVIAIPKIISLDKHVVSITARQITADMRYARNLAVSNMGNYTVKFSPPGGGPYTEYGIFDASDVLIKSRDIPTEDVTCDAVGAFVDDLVFTSLGSTATNNGPIISISESEPEGFTKTISVIKPTGRAFF